MLPDAANRLATLVLFKVGPAEHPFERLGREHAEPMQGPYGREGRDALYQKGTGREEGNANADFERGSRARRPYAARP